MIVLDTHAWLWWCTDRNRLPRTLERRLARETALYVSAISAWEVCMLVEKGRLTLNASPRAAVRALAGVTGIQMVPISETIATEAALLGSDFHGDPADRFIVATTLDLRAKLATKDERITAARQVETIW